MHHRHGCQECVGRPNIVISYILCPGDAIWHHISRSTLVWVIVCHLFSAELLLNQCWLVLNWNKTSVIFKSKYRYFHSRKYTWKCCLHNVSHFVEASMCEPRVQQLMIMLSLCNDYFADEPSTNGLTHCGPVTPYGDMDLSQHWLR